MKNVLAPPTSRKKLAPFALLALLGLESRSAAAEPYFEDVTDTMFPAPACGVRGGRGGSARLLHELPRRSPTWTATRISTS